jgi:pyruvate-ferredoxin/flavodoxin oxidoreductase
VQIARDVSSRADLQQRMQGIVLLGIFLRVTPFQSEHAISEEQLLQGVEKSLRKYFGKRGERVVQDNLKAVHRGYTEVIEVPREIMMATAAVDERNAGLRVI